MEKKKDFFVLTLFLFFCAARSLCWFRFLSVFLIVFFLRSLSLFLIGDLSLRSFVIRRKEKKKKRKRERERREQSFFPPTFFVVPLLFHLRFFTHNLSLTPAEAAEAPSSAPAP